MAFRFFIVFSFCVLLGFSQQDEAFSTEILKERLKTLDDKTPFSIVYDPILESTINDYLINRRIGIQSTITLSSYYFPLIEQELKNQNVPIEAKYLAVIESSLNPTARTSSGIAGLWQFISSTANLYGLNENDLVDDRMDPVKSTQAAAQYLSKLYSIFEDWDLAILSYNLGSGNINKIIDQSGGQKNYLGIKDNLPHQSSNYFNKFLAYMYILEYANEHGFEATKTELNFFETDTVSVKKTIKLEEVSALTKIPLDTVKFLNPSYKLDIIPYYKNESYLLRLPKDAIELFVNPENNAEVTIKTESTEIQNQQPQQEESTNKIIYTVAPGDYLTKIGRLYGVAVSDLKSWNSLASDNLSIGQQIFIYKKDSQPIDPIKREKEIEPVRVKKEVVQTNQDASGNAIIYIVKSGDTLWNISKRFSDITVEDLKKWNNLNDFNIQIGMELKIYKQ